MGACVLVYKRRPSEERVVLSGLGEGECRVVGAPRTSLGACQSEGVSRRKETVKDKYIFFSKAYLFIYLFISIILFLNNYFA